MQLYQILKNNYYEFLFTNYGIHVLFCSSLLPCPFQTAERQRRFRDRLKHDPDRREQFQEKDRQRWHDRKILGKVKGVKDMTDREHRRKITMAIHQLVTHEPYKIASRVVGCLCENDLMCSCYNTNRFQFPTQEHTHQSATEVDAESDTPPENLHEDQSAREVDAESNTRPENLHEDQSATEVDAESDTLLKTYMKTNQRGK